MSASWTISAAGRTISSRPPVRERHLPPGTPRGRPPRRGWRTYSGRLPRRPGVGYLPQGRWPTRRRLRPILRDQGPGQRWPRPGRPLLRARSWRPRRGGHLPPRRRPLDRSSFPSLLRQRSNRWRVEQPDRPRDRAAIEPAGQRRPGRPFRRRRSDPGQRRDLRCRRRQRRSCSSRFASRRSTEPPLRSHTPTLRLTPGPDPFQQRGRQQIWPAFILAIANGLFLYLLPSAAATDYPWSIQPPINAAFLAAGDLAGSPAPSSPDFVARSWRSLRPTHLAVLRAHGHAPSSPRCCTPIGSSGASRSPGSGSSSPW